jgi:asparagine synthase (glutamine-hydrolysing)
MEDTLRGPALRALPFFDRARVIDLLDRLPDMDQGARVAYDQLLMFLLSACVLQERFRLAA